MRASVASFTKKFISTFFAATLALGLVPAAAFADDAAAPDDAPAVTSEEVDVEGTSSELQDGTDASGQDAAASDGLDQSMGGSQDGPKADVAEPAEGEGLAEGDAAAGDDPRAAIPAATERISETVSLTQPVAQQESTRSFFLAQTLESTKTVPIVSANLPLDKGTTDEVANSDAPAEGEGGSEDEGGDGSDESDLGSDASDDASVVALGVSSESMVVGSFTYLGMTFAVEPGGETVALVAVDYSKLPEEFVQKQILVVPDAATPDGVDYYSVTRIAANAFSSLTKDSANPDHTGCIELFSDEELLVEAGIDPADVAGFLPQDDAAAVTEDGQDADASSDAQAKAEAFAYEEQAIDDESDDIRTIVSVDGDVATLDDGSTYTFSNPLEGCAGILVLGIPASVTSIEDDAFAGADTLQCLVVSEDNPEYASFDGALYSADLTNLRLIPEGRVGAVRVASSATGADPEVFSHCPSVDALVADAESVNESIFDTVPSVALVDKAIEPANSVFGIVDSVTAYLSSITSESEKSLNDETYDETDLPLQRSSSLSEIKAAGLYPVHIVSPTGTVYCRISYKSSGALIRDTASHAATYVSPYNPSEQLRDGTTSLSGGKLTMTFYSSARNADLVFEIGINSSLTGIETAGFKWGDPSTYTLGNHIGIHETVGDKGSGVLILFLNGSQRKTVKWDGNGGTSSSSESTWYCGGVYTLPTATRTGYHCTGWFTARTGGARMGSSGGQAAFPSITQISGAAHSGATTYYAQWEVNTYTLKFNVNGGTGSVPADKAMTYGTAYAIPSCSPTRTGYTFDGWATSAGGAKAYDKTASVNNLTTTANGTVTLYAHWSANSYAITYAGNGNTGGSTAPTSATYDQNVTLRANGFSKTGHTFKEWNTAADGSGAGYSAGATLIKPNFVSSGTKTLYAIWSLNSYKVYWRYDGAEGKTDSEESVSYNASFSMKEPGRKPGYSFAGWKASGADANTYAQGVSFTMPGGDVTFTAQWTKSAYTKVNLADTRLQQGIGAVWYWPERGYVDSESSTVVKNEGERIVAPPAVDGYEFLGWYDVQDQNENSETHRMIDASGNLSTETAPSSTITWYAHWKRVSCPVVLAAEYDSIPYVTEKGDESIPYVRFGEAFSSSAEGGRLKALPHRTGYTFMGYWTEKNPETTISVDFPDEFEGIQWVDATGAFSDDVWNLYPTEERGSVTLYAAWQLNDCTVTFDVSVPGSTESVVVTDEAVLAPRTWNYGKPIAALPAPSAAFYRTGYDFGGWYYLKGSDGTKTFVSDADGNPTLTAWNDDVESVVLYADWTAKTYTLDFYESFPEIEGVPPQASEPKRVEVAYDGRLDLDAPSFGAYRFAGWFVNGQSLDGAHMTDGRFTPKGSLLLQTSAPIPVRARWIEPGVASYALYVGAPGGTDLVRESVHEYRYTETIVLNASVAPDPVDGYSFAGWAKVGSDAEARALVAAGGPAADAETTPGFGPFSNEDMFFVAKWTTRELSVTLSSVASEDGTDRLLPTDRLVDHEAEGALPWSAACEGLGVSRPELARTLVYDVTQGRFALPEVTRKGRVFKGWVLQGAGDAVPSLEVVVDPIEQAASPDSLALVYVPVFEDAVYTIVLDGNGLGVDEEPIEASFGDIFAFPYPSTLQTGSCFACWADVPDNASNATRTFFPESSVPVAPVYDEDGTVVEFGLAQLADENNVIRLYAVWNKGYNVEVPLSVSIALDTETGDVIAGSHVLTPWKDGSYCIESLRYEPVFDEAGNAAFAGATDVNLSVYAGLSLGNDADERDLLRAANVGEAGALSYVDAGGVARTATPLLVGLGGTTPLLVAKPALDAVTEEGVNGFNDFGALDPLTVRYGLYFEDAATLERFAYEKSKAGWTLPENDGAGENGWSSESVPVARLRYTVSLL